MKKILSSTAGLYRRYRKFSKSSKAYRAANYFVIAVASVYCSLLLFPQILFANEMSHKNFRVHSRQPLNDNMKVVLDAAEVKLQSSPIYRSERLETLVMADSFGLYKFLTLKGNSLGSTIPVVGLSRINKSDIDNDLVYRDSEAPNSRSLSSVIAHETMHNQIREHLGNAKYFRLATWKDEGYCEYIAGETTLSFEEGRRRWRESPNDSSRYDYFKYHQMVKYLLDDQKISVDDFLSQTFDEKQISDTVFAKINQL